MSRHETLPEIELVPLARPPLDASKMDVTLAADPLPQLEEARRSRRRWRATALVSLSLLALTLFLIGIQLGNTWTSMHHLQDARQQAEAARAETQRALAQQQKVYDKLVEDRRELAVLQNHCDVLIASSKEWQVKFGALLQKEADLELQRPEWRRMLAKEVECAATRMNHDAGLAVGRIRQEGDEYLALLEFLVLSQMERQLSDADPYTERTTNPLVPRRRRASASDE